MQGKIFVAESRRMGRYEECDNTVWKCGGKGRLLVGKAKSNRRVCRMNGTGAGIKAAGGVMQVIPVAGNAVEAAGVAVFAAGIAVCR